MFKKKAFFMAAALLHPCTQTHANATHDTTATDNVPARLGTLVIKDDTHEENNQLLLPKAQAPSPSDLAEWLRNAPGVQATRMGGQGLDLIMRGQSQARILILNDGMAIHGGCPNRMDPPTLYMPGNASDRITLLPGLQTFEWGSASSAGTLLVEQDNWALPDGMSSDVRLQGNSNGQHSQISVDGSWQDSRHYLRLTADRSQQGNYKDGQARTVRAAFKKRNVGLSAGLERGAHRLEIKLNQTRDRDTLYAGAGMDSPQADLDQWQWKYQWQPEQGRIRQLELTDGVAEVLHIMDNYSLRPRTAPMAMRVESQATTRTSRAKLGLDLWAGQWLLGLDRTATRWLASRMTGMTESRINLLQSRMWPDVHQSEQGLYLQGVWPWGSHQFKLGLRVDQFHSSARATGQALGKPTLPTPVQLYTRYYGAFRPDWRERHVSGFVRLEQDLDDRWSAFINAGRSWRMPDATERYLAANASMPMLRWVGNPNLTAEQHQSLDLGLVFEQSSLHLGATFWLDQVDNYILRDRAHGQAGILQTDGASIYRNVDARLYGLSLSTRLDMNAHWSLRFQADYTHGQNETDQQPLARIPPLSGLLGLDYRQARYRLGMDLRWASEQTRVDDNPMYGAGLDAGPGDGWAVPDLFAEKKLAHGWTLSARIDNLFDKTYAYHVNRANSDPFNPIPIRVNEPGRTFWLSLRWDNRR